MAALSPERTERLVDALYPVHGRIFSGLTRESFARLVLSDHAESTEVEIFRDPAGRVVGFCALHRYERVVLGRASIVYRADAGLLPPYRGGASTWWFALRRALAEKLRAPWRPLYYLGTLIHPSSYCLLAERFPVIHPHRARETPPALRRAMAALADSFEFPAASEDRLIRHVGWATRQEPEDLRRWAATPHPDAQFYRHANPRHGEGFGLVTLVPLTPLNMLGGMVNHLLLTLPGVRRWRGLSAGEEGGA